MTETKTYNGWTNYETWNVALWMDNEENTQRYWQDRTKELKESATDEVGINLDAVTDELADEIRSEVEEGNPLADAASMYSDLLGAALSEVNWHEIARNWLAD